MATTSIPSATALAIRCGALVGNHGNRRVGLMIVKKGDDVKRVLPIQLRVFSSGGNNNNNNKKDNNPLPMFSTRRPRGEKNSNPRGKTENEEDPLELFKLRRAPRSKDDSDDDSLLEPFQMLQTNRRAELRNHSIQLFPGDYQDDGDDDSFLGGGSGDKSVFGGDLDLGGDSGFEDPLDVVDEDYEEVEAAVKALKEEISQREEQKKRWITNAEQPDYQPQLDALGRAYGRGARKSAHARVWIQPGFGHVVVNKHDFIEYFPRRSDREKILDPLVVTDTVGEFDVKAIVRGGGLTGQANAIQLGVARALVNYRPDLWRQPLKHMGFLTRDARVVERKKTGLVKARKAPQWNRR